MPQNNLPVGLPPQQLEVDIPICHSYQWARKLSLHLLYIKTFYYMTWVFCRSNACSDWLILGHYSPVIFSGRLRACKSQTKSHIINNLLTSNVWSLREKLKSRPCRIDLAIARSIRQGLGPRFSRKDLTLG